MADSKSYPSDVMEGGGDGGSSLRSEQSRMRGWIFVCIYF